MTTYTVNNSAGAVVATILPVTNTGTTFPIVLVGQGTSTYGQTIAQTQYHLLENFNSTTAPANPVQGMTWYDPTNDTYSYYDGTVWNALASAASNSASLIAKVAGISLIATGDTVLFTDPNIGNSYHATGLLLKVNGTPTLTIPALVNLKITTSEDVMENVSVNLSTATQHGYYIIQGTTTSATAGASISLEVTLAATTSLTVDAYLFGFKT
jgi:hypothetical protein